MYRILPPSARESQQGGEAEWGGDGLKIDIQTPFFVSCQISLPGIYATPQNQTCPTWLPVLTQAPHSRFPMLCAIISNKRASPASAASRLVTCQPVHMLGSTEFSKNFLSHAGISGHIVNCSMIFITGLVLTGSGPERQEKKCYRSKPHLNNPTREKPSEWLTSDY